MSGDPALDRSVEAVVNAIDVLSRFEVDTVDLDLDELATVWMALDDARRVLDVIVNDYAVNVGEKLADMPYERKDGYQLPNGELVHHAQRASEKWAGRRLLGDLSTMLIDPDTGEQTPAIPTVVLEQIVPGTADDKLTSSRWGITGLVNLGVDPDDYRTREWKRAKVQRGPGR